MFRFPDLKIDKIPRAIAEQKDYLAERFIQTKHDMIVAEVYTLRKVDATEALRNGL